MKYAIVGSRTFDSYSFLKEKLNSFTDISVIISGGAAGADKLAEKFAEEKSIPIKIYYPNWELHGKKAGFLRNIDIVQNCDVLVAFWDGESKGTLHSII